MTKVFLALGANVGDTKSNIEKATALIGQKLSGVKTAPIYKTKPWGYTKQPYFLNTALSGKTDLTPEELLDFVKDVEKKVGRRKRIRWGPREIDVDLIFYGETVSQSKRLTIPHRDAWRRDFVLKPIVDLEPNLVHPLLKKPITKLLEDIPRSEKTIISPL
ncbi:2-amino-4-hydroxy-6-hydroxymethyldihydropteridine diphosphokinase [Patescibacteria group bacterium]|nr:2-amino-4-hydroxy-6-hydroxymethyldihydropteridine diphosphokinase [Patescibacteria group bacterium]